MVASKVIGSKQANVKYTDRHAVRTIVLSANKSKIALIFVQKGQYYKIPGGGIELDEDHGLAAEREALEETGCKVKIEGACLATSEEWRNDLHQHSYCYVARLLEDTGRPELTEQELAEGLKHEWLSVPEAIAAIRNSKPTSELGKFIKERDLFFVESFAKLKWSLIDLAT